MVTHLSLGNTLFGRTKQLKQLINNGKICFGGNQELKIYGTLNCKSGKRMKAENRVFFTSAKEAVELNYRPCAHCMNAEYKHWKKRRTEH